MTKLALVAAAATAGQPIAAFASGGGEVSRLGGGPLVEVGPAPAGRIARKLAEAMASDDLRGWSITIKGGDARQSIFFSNDDRDSDDLELKRLGDRMAELVAEHDLTMEEGNILDDAAFEVAGGEPGSNRDRDREEQQQWYQRFMAARIANGGEALACRGKEICDELAVLSKRVREMPPAATVVGLMAKFQALDWEVGYLLEEHDVEGSDYQPGQLLREFAEELSALAHARPPLKIV